MIALCPTFTFFNTSVTNGTRLILCRSTLRLQCNRPPNTVPSDYHRLIWCSYVPDPPDTEDGAERTNPGGNDDGAMILVVTHDNIVNFTFDTLQCSDVSMCKKFIRFNFDVFFLVKISISIINYLLKITVDFIVTRII